MEPGLKNARTDDVELESLIEGPWVYIFGAIVGIVLFAVSLPVYDSGTGSVWLGIVGMVAVIGGARAFGYRRRVAAALATRDVLGEGSAVCLFSWSMQDGAWLSSRWNDVLDVSASEPPTLEGLLERVHASDRARLHQSVEGLLRGDSERLQQLGRFQVRGEYRWIEMTANAHEVMGRLTIAGSMMDVTDRRRIEAQLSYNAFHDQLTLLPNRSLLENRLVHCAARSRRNPAYQFAVIFLDLDGFKTINDSLGHRAGDALLAAVATRLKEVVRPGDTVARLGGDEFTVVLDPIEATEDAVEVARRLLEALSAPMTVEGRTLKTGASVGIACSSRGYADVKELLRDADIAMYAAKTEGKNRIRLFDQAMHDTVMRKLYIETLLKQNRDSGEWVVHYQPILDLVTGEILGFEALVRMRDSDGRIIGPGQFIEAAEELGVVNAILDGVLADACSRLASWLEVRPDLYVSVNVSARSVNPGLVKSFKDFAQSSGIPATAIKLELTESVLALGESTAIFDELRQLGYGLYVDDFGTGFSSLYYMHSFNIEVIKIDRAFVQELDGETPVPILETVMDLSTRLGSGVIAEGIEKVHQARQLIECGCRVGQGFLFSPAVDPEVATRYVRDGRNWSHLLQADAKPRISSAG